MTVDVLHVSLPDVALLARVQRPPVSMWRRRFAGSGTPFPAPVHVRGTQPFFDGHAVVDWLETTGLGRNPHARDDLAAFAALAGTGEDDDTVFAGLTALLCLSSFDVRLPTDGDDLEDLADDVDPDDEFLYSEVLGLGERLEPMARYTALLIDAAGHAAAAFESLMRRRTHRPGSGHARTAVATPARNLVADLAFALGTHAEIATPCYVDPTPGASDLIVELARRAGEGAAITVATPDVDCIEGRLARRRIRVHDIAREPLVPDGHGGYVVPDDAVVLMQLPAPGRPDLPDVDLLQEIENVVLGMEAARCAVVLGPASALTDRVRGEAALLRDGLLRTDRVRGVVRLPAGLLPTRSRARLALWCLGPPPPDTGEARTLVADLADTALDGTAIAELVIDLVAGLRDARPWRAHTARFTRSVPTRILRAERDDLVVPRPVARSTDTAAELAEQAGALREQLAAPLPAPAVPQPAPRAAARGPIVTLGTAVAERDVEMLSGLRIDTAHLDPGAAVRVVRPADLTGATDRVGIDRLVLAAHYESARFTEPGDVVFTVSPRPAAVVDRDGGAVVAFPARALRSRSAAFVPHVLAADITAQPATAKTWRAWSVRTVPADQAEALTGMLDDLDRHRRALTDRITQLDQLAAALVAGTAAGAFDLHGKDPRASTDQEGRPGGAVDDEGTQGHALEGR
ncbi:hypothetical protein [Pseudonocardia lacus]|uniref:hypothetical protein n=1 Tax=Pseudonocardia lacus TaxID=2835865 RepID=UPI001BDD7504|nr:hypothetical protein [Pseudonocardia lacus]